jgi:predicted amino acid racemase
LIYIVVKEEKGGQRSPDVELEGVGHHLAVLKTVLRTKENSTLLFHMMTQQRVHSTGFKMKVVRFNVYF